MRFHKNLKLLKHESLIDNQLFQSKFIIKYNKLTKDSINEKKRESRVRIFYYCHITNTNKISQDIF